MQNMIPLALAGLLVSVMAEGVIPGEYIALLSENASDLTVASHHEFVKSSGMQITHVYNISASFRGFAFAEPASGGTLRAAAPMVAAALSSRQGVEAVEPNMIVSIADASNINATAAPPRECKVQNSPPWNLDRIWQRDATQWWFGRYWYGRDGNGVTVYIIDTGINTNHVDFGGRASWGADFCGKSGDALNTDVDGHGTHVAGTVMSDSYGVAKKARAVAIKVLCKDKSKNTKAQNIAGIDVAVQLHKASKNKKSVINLSLGGPKHQVENAAVDAAVSAGLTVVVAAGNGKKENGNVPVDACTVSPGSAVKPITVMSSDSDDSFSSFSNYGSCGDIIAPGRDILSTSIGSKTATATLSGTSMATPHVAGAAAQLLAQDLSPTAVKNALLKMATPNKIASPKLDPKGLSPKKLLFSYDCPGSAVKSVSDTKSEETVVV